MQQLNLLGAARVNRIMQGLQDPRLLPGQLLWTNRIPVVPAADEELTARFIGTIQIADMIADDARGVIYSMGRFQYETTKVPNLKVGMGMNQSTLNQLDRLTGIGTFRGDLDAFGSWQTRALASVRLGVLQRMEQLRVAMLCDGIGFAYDRFGIKLTNPSWGMFADLKVTVGAVPADHERHPYRLDQRRPGRSVGHGEWRRDRIHRRPRRADVGHRQP
jgi:hypothetical protein